MSPPPWRALGPPPHPALPWSHPPISPDFSVLHKDSGQMALRSQWPQPDSNHHPLLGPPLGKSRVLGRKDTNWLTNGFPGLSLKESATPVLTGSERARCPPAGKSHCRVLPGLEKGPASHLLTEAGLRSGSGISMPVTGSLSSLQGLWCLAPQPSGPSPICLEPF